MNARIESSPTPRCKTIIRAAAVLMAAGLLSSCALKFSPPQTSEKNPRAAWARALHDRVDRSGRVDFEGIRNSPRDLDAAAAFVAHRTSGDFHDPARRRNVRLAFYINAYNTLAMYHAAHSGIEPRSKIRFFFRSRLKLGGEWTSLYDFENKVIRPLGEPRIHFALNCMVRGCPRLPQEAFSAELLDVQLERAAREFLNEERNVRLDHENKTVSYSKILKWYKKDFLASAPSLTAYANRYRSVKIPEDYDVKFLPYDWTLNSRPALSR